MQGLKNKKGQGTTEYIVILGIVIAIAVGLVKSGLLNGLQTGINNIGSSVATATQPQAANGGH